MDPGTIQKTRSGSKAEDGLEENACMNGSPTAETVVIFTNLRRVCFNMATSRMQKSSS